MREQRNHQLRYLEGLGREYAFGTALLSPQLEPRQGPVEPLVVTGPGGCGKTLFLARLGTLAEQRGWRVLPMFAGLLGQEPEPEVLCRYLTEGLGQWSRKTPIEGPDYAGQVRQCLPEWEPGTPETLVLLDGVKPEVLEQVVPEPVMGVRFAVSLEQGEKWERKTQRFVLPALDVDQRMALLQNYYGTGGFRPSPMAMAAMAKKKSSGNPLYLTLLAQRLQVAEEGKSQSDAAARQIRIVDAAPEQTEALCVELLGVVAQKAGGNMAVQTMGFVAMSGRGLREGDLQAIFQEAILDWNPVIFAKLKGYLSRFLLERDDGRVEFRNGTFRRGILSCFKNRSVMHRTMLQALSTLPEEDPVGLEERLYHLLTLREPRDVLTLLNRLPEGRYGQADRRLVPVLKEQDWSLLRQLLTPGPGLVWQAGGFRYLLHLWKNHQAPRDLLEPAAAILDSQGEKGPAYAKVHLYPQAAAENRENPKNLSRLEKALLCLLTREPEVRDWLGMKIQYPLTRDPELDPTGERGREILELLLPLYRKGGDCRQEKRALDLRQCLLTWEPVPEDLERQGEICLAMAREILDSSVASQWNTGVLWFRKALELERQGEEAGKPEQRPVPPKWWLWEQELQNRLVALAQEPMVGEPWKKEAAALAEQRLQYAKGLEPDTQGRTALALAWASMADVAALEEGEDGIRRSLEACQKSFALLKALSKEGDTPANRSHMARSYESIARMYVRMGGADNLYRAAELYRRGVTARQKVYAALETPESCVDMIRAHMALGQTLQADPEQMPAAAGQYGQANLFAASLCQVWQAPEGRYLLAEVLKLQSSLPREHQPEGLASQLLALLPELAALETGDPGRASRHGALLAHETLLNLARDNPTPELTEQAPKSRREVVRLTGYGFG